MDLDFILFAIIPVCSSPLQWRELRGGSIDFSNIILLLKEFGVVGHENHGEGTEFVECI